MDPDMIYSMLLPLAGVETAPESNRIQINK